MSLVPYFITGAYLIRNKKNYTVLTTDQVKFDHDSGISSTDQQLRFWNQQTWWIEPLPVNGKKSDPIYSITNPASGRALTVIPGESNILIMSIQLTEARVHTLNKRETDREVAYAITAAENRGETWQRWKIWVVNDDQGE